MQAIAAHINGGGMKACHRRSAGDLNKLLGNLGNAPMPADQVSIRDLFQGPDCVAAAGRVMQEAAAVANALGAKPDADHDDRRIAHGRSLDPARISAGPGAWPADGIDKSRCTA